MFYKPLFVLLGFVALAGFAAKLKNFLETSIPAANTSHNLEDLLNEQHGHSCQQTNASDDRAQEQAIVQVQADEDLTC